MAAWLAAIAELRSQGLEPMPQRRFFVELGGLMNYICNLITKDSAALPQCKAGLPKTLPAPAAVLGPAASVGFGNIGRPVGASRPGSPGGRPPVAVPASSPGPAAMMGNALTAVEKTVTVSDGMRLQQALCVTPSSEFDTSTRDQLKNFNAAFLYPANGATNQISRDGDLINLRAAQGKFSDCKRAGFRNGFEVGLFARFGSAKVRSDLTEALAVAGILAPAKFGTAPAAPLAIDDATRQAIGSLATKYGLETGSEITRNFYDRMSKSLER